MPANLHARDDREHDAVPKTEGELAPDGDFVRGEINERYESSHPTDANAPPVLGGKLDGRDLPGPGQDAEAPVEMAVVHRPRLGEGPPGAVHIDESGALLDDQGRPLGNAEAQRVLSRLRDKYPEGGAGNGNGGGMPGGPAAPGLLAKALASVRRKSISLSEITGRKDTSGAEFVEGDGHSEELEEGETPEPFNKSLPPQVQKIVDSLRSVRKASLPLGAGGERLTGNHGDGYAAIGDTGPNVTARRDGGLTGHLKSQDASRLAKMGHEGGTVAGANLNASRLAKQGTPPGGKGGARISDGFRSGGSGHGGSRFGGGGKK
jgi:hypothetical protein